MDKARLIQHDMNHIQKVYKEQQHDFFAVTIRPQESFIRQFKQSDRTEVVQELTLSVIKKVQSHLIRKPMKNSTKHLLIDHINVIETKTKYGSKDIEHQHGLWIVHKDISQRLNEKFINQITQSSSFKLYDQKYRFVDAMHSIRCDRISTQSNLFMQWDKELRSWLDYIYKHSTDAGNNFYNEWLAFSHIKNSKSKAARALSNFHQKLVA